MKAFPLSTPGERVAGVAAAVGMISAFIALLYTLRSNIALLIFCGLCAGLISALLVIYAVNVVKASATVDAEKKLLHVRGIKNYTLDLSEATMLQTILRKNAQSTVRLLVFSNQDDEIIATVSTMFIFRQGMWAEPMAREMAKELGIEFQQNLPDWLFDKKLYQQHIKEESEQQKKEAKERRKKRAEMRIQKIKNRK